MCEKDIVTSLKEPIRYSTVGPRKITKNLSIKLASGWNSNLVLLVGESAAVRCSVRSYEL
jgi:hypothetical protein